MTAPKRGAPVGLPISASFAEVTERLSAKRSINQDALTPADTRSAWRDRGVADNQQHVADSYRVDNPAPSAIDLRKPDFDGTPLQLDVDQIQSYDHNPRFFENAAFADIKAGLKASGFTGAFAVTRRRANPGEPYMLCAGGNSTLEALRQLYNETGEERFKRVNCVFHEYRGEEAILAQHLGENLNRGDMKFWEVAVGVSKLIGMMSEAAGKVLTQVELERDLPKRGVVARRTTIGIWMFAAKRLAALGPRCVELTMPDVQVHLQPHLNHLRKLAAKFGISEESYWTDVIDPALAGVAIEFEQSEVFTAAGACEACEVALAEHVGGDESATSIRSMLAVLEKNPASTLADLRAPRRLAHEVLSNFPATVRTGNADPAGAIGEARAEALGARSQPAGTTPACGPARPAAAVHAAESKTDGAALEGVPTVTPDTASSPAGVPLPPVPTDGDPLADLHEALVELTETAEMTDCIRWWPAMPYGFFMEIPSSALHPDEVVEWGSPPATARRHKQIVWWLLVRLSGQAQGRCEALMDKASLFFQDASDTYGLRAVQETAMGGPDRDFDVMELLTDPNDVVMYWLLRVVDRMRVLNARDPTRWPPDTDSHFIGDSPT